MGVRLCFFRLGAAFMRNGPRIDGLELADQLSFSQTSRQKLSQSQ
jgi:hypothetical protein